MVRMRHAGEPASAATNRLVVILQANTCRLYFEASVSCRRKDFRSPPP